MKTRTNTLSLLTALAAVALVALAVAGCGGGADQATAASGSSSMATSSGTISVSDNGNLGKILVDAKGNTVYLFEKDTGPMSTCFGACAADWPPVTTTGKPTAGSGVTGSMLGTTNRSDGTTQVVYNGHPVYRYIGDQKAGDTNGQNVNAFGAEWYALSPAGDKVSGNGSAGSSGGSYGY
jgi:predicted lipoprotein with Yx(FWY)xxD motif